MAETPHVVIIMADQLRYDVLGKGFTPNIDQIAEQGVVFNHAYCASPLCVPARGGFFTGKYPNLNGSLINPWLKLDAHHGKVRAGTPNLYRMMEGKWDSWHAGKQHLYTAEGQMEYDPDSQTHWISTEETYRALLKRDGVKPPGGAAYRGRVAEMSQGRTTWTQMYSIPTTGCYQADFKYFFDGHFLDGALQAIRNRDQAKPFLLNAMFLAPHPPLEIPEPWYSMIQEAVLPENVGIWCDQQSPLQMYNLTGILGTRYTRKDWQEVWRVYLGLVSLLDHCVGMISNELQSAGIYDDTLIIFTSDHGEMLGSHCLWQKMCMYEESARIPLYIKFPADYIPAVKQIDEPVSAVDVLPTLCDFLKLPIPENLSGISLLPAIKGEKTNRENIFIQFDGNGSRSNFQRCIIQKNYKLIVDIFKDEIFLELYDIVNDRQEFTNLAFTAEYRPMVLEMLDTLNKHMRDTGDLLELPDGVYDRFMNDYSQLINSLG